MTDIVGRGTIELVGDARKLKASIDDAKKSIRTLGEGQKDISAKASQSIDQYIGRLQQQNATLGKSARETELFKLSLRGASNEQLKAADSALLLTERHQKMVAVGDQIKTSFLAIGAIAATGLIAAAAAFDQLVNKAGNFQDMAEKVGDTAENLASLAVSASVGGASMETVVAASVKLTKGLTGVDDESKAAGAAIAAIGLNLEDFKRLGAADQFEAVAKALAGFEEGSGKTAVAVALFGKAGADMLPFLKELGAEGGRQTILTSEQIRLADEYGDKQKKLTEQISLHAQAIASNLLPQLTALKTSIADLAKDQEHAATASDLLTAAFAAALVPLQTIAVLASDVGFVFLGVGREIGAIAAQLAALARLDFAGFSAISDAVKEDAERARGELDKFQEKVMALGQPAAAVSGAPGPWSGPVDQYGQPINKPKLVFGGAIKSGKDDALKAAQEAQKEIDRLLAAGVKSEEVAAAARYDAANDAYIAEGQRNLKRINELKKVNLAYEDAAAAAVAYMDTIVRQNARELAGIGRGAKFRDNQAGISAIEDKQIVERQRLDAELRKGQIDKDTFDRYLAVVNDTYAKEIAAYEQRSATLIEKEGDWLNGANEAMQNYFDASRNVAKQTEEMFTRAFQGMEDAMVNFVKTGKLDFKSLADSVISDLIRIQIRQQMVGSLSQAAGFGSGWLKGLFGASTQAPAPVSEIAWGGAQAVGGDYIVTKPTLFMAGEAGPERATFSGANKAGGSGPVFNVDLRGASVDAVARLERFVASVDGSIERRAFNVMKQAPLRGAR